MANVVGTYKIDSMETASKTSEQRRRPSFLMILGLTAVAGLAAGNAIAIVSATSSPSTPPAEVATGVAACEDNLPIEGVWVSAGPSSGWANKIPGASPTEVSFSRVTHVSSYTVHVGCGGSPEHWQFSDIATSNAVTNFPVGFECGPPSGKVEPADQGICEQVGVTTLKAAA